MQMETKLVFSDPNTSPYLPVCLPPKCENGVCRTRMGKTKHEIVDETAYSKGTGFRAITDLKIVSNKKCSQLIESWKQNHPYGGVKRNLKNDHICTDVDNSNRFSEGDRGGPLTIEERDGR